MSKWDKASGEEECHSCGYHFKQGEDIYIEKDSSFAYKCVTCVDKEEDAMVDMCVSADPRYNEDE